MQHSTARVPITALIISLVLGLSGCGDTPLPEFSPRTPGTAGTLRIGVERVPDSLNPGNGLSRASYDLYELVYDTPIALGPDGAYVPELASSWQVSDDGLTWTLEIVKGAMFHDGSPLTSEDIEYSLELYRDTEGFPYMPSYADAFLDVEAPSPSQLVIRTARPTANFEARMVYMYVLPKHIWQEQADPIAFDNARMIGSGPFELDAVEPGVSVGLEANDEYWNGSPSVDELSLSEIGDPAARVSALADGDLDLITDLPPAAAETLRGTDDVEIYAADGVPGRLADLFFNVIDPTDCPTQAGGLCTGHPALRDVEVRRALALALDKQRVIDDALLGYGSPGRSLVPPGLGEWSATGTADHSDDVDAAAAQLDAAGYEDLDEDGVRECRAEQNCSTGDLTFRFMFPSSSATAAREAELLAEMWGAIGVKIETVGLDPDTLASACCPTFDYDVIRWGWSADADPSFVLGMARCDEIATGLSETGYCNQEYDDLYAEQASELDHDARVEDVHRLQRILADDLPYIVPYYEHVVQAYRTDTFTGWLTGERTLGLQHPAALQAIRPLEQGRLPGA